MSLIYAFKTSFGVRIISDTKLSVDDNDKNKLMKRLSKEDYNNAIKYGVIKTVIYKPTITILAAGVLEHFNELLEILKMNNIEDAKDVLKYAEDIHNKYNEDTDFIVTVKNDIYQIKNKCYQSVVSAWIGDRQAFSIFQKERLSFPVDFFRNAIGDESSDDDIESTLEIGRTGYAFKNVVENKCVNSVGGMTVTCSMSEYTNYEYEYFSEYASIPGYDSIQTIPSGEWVTVKFFHDVRDGGISGQILQSKKEFIVYLDNVGIGIVYKSGYRDMDYNNLLLPSIVHCSLDELLEKYPNICQCIRTS